MKNMKKGLLENVNIKIVNLQVSVFQAQSLYICSVPGNRKPEEC